MIAQLDYEIIPWRNARDVPDNRKSANTVLIFKKREKQTPGNLRVVSLTSVPSKIPAKIITKLISEPHENNVVITRSQHRSRRLFLSRKKCCETIFYLIFFRKVSPRNQ